MIILRTARVRASLAALTAICVVSSSTPARAEPAGRGDCRTFKPRPIGPKTTGTPRAPQLGSAWQSGRQFERVLIVVLENQDYEIVMRDPYFRQLAQRGTLLTHYNGLFHPSYANYLALIGGKYFGTRSDDQRNLPRSQRTIADLLESKGLTWRQYAEGYPGGCYTADAAPGPLYRRKHVPFLSFESITKNPSRCASVVPASQFDRGHLPNFGFYSPDMCHDGHDLCGSTLGQRKGASAKVRQSAAWLEGFLEPLLADPAVTRDTLIVVTFDESGNDANNHIYTVLLGDMIQPAAQVDACYDHYNLLRTIEDNFGLGTLGEEDEKSDPIVADVWRAAVSTSAR
ncbi:MAG: alkaline phosphatase family protein [Myxococcales bacterium]